MKSSNEWIIIIIIIIISKTLPKTRRIYNENIGIEFDLKKCVLIIRKSGISQITEEKELPNQDRIRKLGEKENNKHLGYWERTPSNQQRWKKEYQRSTTEERENSKISFISKL